MNEQLGDIIDYGTTPQGERIQFPRLQHDGKFTRIQGAIGRGKTVAMANNAGQFLKPYHRDGIMTRDFVCIIDFAGSAFMRNYIECQCRELGVPFQCLHLDPDCQHTYDPLKSSGFFRGNATRKATFICNSFNMIHGEGDQRYFGRMNLEITSLALEELEKEGIAAPTLHELAGKLRDIARRPQHARHAAEALFVLGPLLPYAQLSEANSTPENRICIATAMEQAGCVYFELPTIFDGSVARAVGTLAMWNVVIEAAARVQRGAPVRHTQLYIDEIAQVAGGLSFHDVVTLVRKFFVRLTVAHQSKTQLTSGPMPMYEILRDNCFISLLLSVSTAPDGDLDDLQADSLDVIKKQRSVTSRGLSGGVTLQEREEPAITRNDAISLNWGQVGEAYLVFRTNKGEHREPIRLRLSAPVSPADFDRLSVPSSPRKPTEPDAIPSADPTAGDARPMTAERIARHALLTQLATEILATERWQIIESPVIQQEA